MKPGDIVYGAVLSFDDQVTVSRATVKSVRKNGEAVLASREAAWGYRAQVLSKTLHRSKREALNALAVSLRTTVQDLTYKVARLTSIADRIEEIDAKTGKFDE